MWEGQPDQGIAIGAGKFLHPGVWEAGRHRIAGSAGSGSIYFCNASYTSVNDLRSDRRRHGCAATGYRWSTVSRQRVRSHDKLLLILPEHSMSSEWVKTEIAKARKREVNEGKRVLFPVRLVGFETPRDWECFDGDTGKDSAREIREYFIPDFSNWKDQDSYQTAFQRLVGDLKAEAV